MKGPQTLAAPLLSASLLAAGCAPKRASFKEVVRGTTGNVNLSEEAMQSPGVIRVSVNAERKVFFGDERVGTVNDLGPLKERVRQAVERNRRAARDAGESVHLDNVYFCAPVDFKYGDVAGVIEAIKEAGGDPTGVTGCDPPR